MDEPVENRSDSFAKPNCGVAHSTISSAKRDRCTAQIEAAAERTSRTKSRSATRVERIGGGAVEAERLPPWHVAIDRKGGPGQRGRPERALVEARPGRPGSVPGPAPPSRYRPADDGRSVTGCADCRCVKPGMTVPACSTRLVDEGPLEVGEADGPARRWCRCIHRVGNPPPPGRCASAPCAAGRPPRRSGRRGASPRSCGCPRGRARRRTDPLSISWPICLEARRRWRSRRPRPK